MLRIARGTANASLWQFFVVVAGGCEFMPSLDHGQHQNGKGANL